MSEQPTHTKTYRKLVEGTTINNTSLLSTDYLNHFNELVMLLEMVADMPDMMEEVKLWHPKTYAEHFADSVFTHKDLAIAAYEHAPIEFKDPFDKTVDAVNDAILSGLPHLEDIISQGDPEIIRHEAVSFTRNVQQLTERASAIINGVVHEEMETQQIVEEEDAEKTVMDQNAIDSLFN
ncbi:hypothetical protein [Curvivirga sp.]|uniref:hypothetical protein n=1 Tax=Curvivirga sp. TaxID=2856848 RepID=UPI003B58B9B0